MLPLKSKKVGNCKTNCEKKKIKMLHKLRMTLACIDIEVPRNQKCQAGAKDPGFISTFTKHFQRFISRAFTYNADGLFVSSWCCAHQCGFISSSYLWIKLSNNLGQRLCVSIVPQLTKQSIFARSVNWYRQ